MRVALALPFTNHGVIPAQAGIHLDVPGNEAHVAPLKLDPGLRRDDSGWN